MKKNLRIVSAAAAALLAVAPVAASAVSTVSASAITSVNVGNQTTPLPNNADVDLSSSVQGVTTYTGKTDSNGNKVYTNGLISGSLTATLSGTKYNANFTSATSGVSVTTNAESNPATIHVANMEPGSVAVNISSPVQFNFGSANANKKVTVNVPSNMTVTFNSDNKPSVTGAVSGKEVTVTTDQSGVVTLDSVKISNVKVVETSDVRAVAFYNVQTGSVVTTGDITINAGTNGRANVQQIVNAFAAKYQAAQLNNANDNSNVKLTNNTPSAIAALLRAQGITVDAQGYFTAPKSFTLNMTAASTENDATATLPVTVTVPNGVATTPTAVATTGNVTIMHAAYTYELKDGKLTRVTSQDTLHAYSSIPVYGTTTVNGKKYYRVSATENWYINAGNVDGTSRTLGHNAYVYNNKGKRVKSEGTWKKGSSHKTYGAAMNVKGSRMYRVGRNRYVKVVNFN